MLRKMYSVYDQKAGAFTPPFFANTLGMALRSFQAAVLDPSHDFYKFSDDFTLFFLGDFEDTDGTFKLAEVREQVAWATNFKAKLVPVPDTQEGR